MAELTLDKVFLFLLLAMPGVVAIRAYGLWVPSIPKDWKDQLVDAVSFSLLNAFVWYVFFPSIVYGFVTGLFSNDAEPNSVPKSVVVVLEHVYWIIGYTLLSPIALTYSWYSLRASVLHRRLGIDHPVRTAWDWVFLRGDAMYLLFVLKSMGDGKQTVIVGYFDGSSYVTTYPLEAEIYVERLHVFNPDKTIGRAVPDSKGMLIKYSECERIEFLRDPAFVRRVPFWKRVNSTMIVFGKHVLLAICATGRFIRHPIKNVKGVCKWQEDQSHKNGQSPTVDPGK